MADLLECLIQIKGVADTPRRLTSRVGAAAGLGGRAHARAAAVARRMAIAEECFGQCLAVLLSEDRPQLPRLPRVDERFAVRVDEDSREMDAASAADWLGQFSAARAAIAACLDRCSAEQLNRTGLEPARGPMTVADLVAVMLAHDTDCLGAIRAA